jgi:hypothetical protein
MYLAPPGIRLSDRPARRVVAIPTTLLWLPVARVDENRWILQKLRNHLLYDTMSSQILINGPVTFHILLTRHSFVNMNYNAFNQIKYT